METNESTVPLVDQVKLAMDSLGDGMYSSLMGTFDILAPINYLGSKSVGNSIATVVNRTNHWVLPTRHEPHMPLSAVEVAYQAIVDTTTDSIMTPSTVSEEYKEDYLPSWEENSLNWYDCFDMVFPSNESILEAMSGRDKIFEDLHHRSYFVP